MRTLENETVEWLQKLLCTSHKFTSEDDIYKWLRDNTDMYFGSITVDAKELKYLIEDGLHG